MRQLIYTSFLMAIAIKPLYAAPDCDCSHLAALQQELKNARTLQTRFQQESANLKSMGPQNSSSAFQHFAQGPAGQGIQSPPGYSGPSSMEKEAHGIRTFRTFK